jgi:uncharacterized membrane protein
MSILPGSERGGRLRWLLLGSLALNLFFAGPAGAVAFRYSSPVPLTTVTHIGHSLTGRFDRMAESLPPADAEILRTEITADANKIAATQADLRLSQEDVRKSLRAEPFDADVMRTAMAENRNARDNFDVALHDMLASAAAKMSVVGRVKLADWPAERDNGRPAR